MKVSWNRTERWQLSDSTFIMAGNILNSQQATTDRIFIEENKDFLFFTAKHDKNILRAAILLRNGNFSLVQS